MPKSARKSSIWIIILSALDFAFGIIAIFASTLAVKVIGTMVSGLTLAKAIQVSLKSKKGVEIVVKTAIRAIPYITRYALKKNKEKPHMKDFFKKLGTNLKNNKITAIVVVFIALLCAGGGYAINFIVERIDFAPAPYNIIIAVAITVVIFAILAIAVIYLGHDNKWYALIRKATKVIGDEQTAVALDKLKETVLSDRLNAEIEAEREAAQKAADEEIWKRICAEKAEKEKAERDYQIAQWKKAHLEAVEISAELVKENPEPVVDKKETSVSYVAPVVNTAPQVYDDEE